MSKNDEQELQDIKLNAKESCLTVMSEIVTQVIKPILSNDKAATSSSISEISARPRLGLMRLSALELLDKLQMCYGIRILDVIKEAELLPELLKMYAVYPYNDIALRHVNSIISYALDTTLAKAITEKLAPPKRPSTMLDLEPINTLDEDMKAMKEQEMAKNELTQEEEQNRKDALLVYMLFSTSLTEDIITMCRTQDKLSYSNKKNTTEMGYVAHLSQLAQLLQQIGEKNELI